MKAVLVVLAFALFAGSACHAFALDKKKSQVKLKVAGRIMLDYDHFDAAFNGGESGDDFNLRRASVSLEAAFSKNWEAKLQISYLEKDKEFVEKDLHLTYKGWRFANLRLGKFKQSFGLENSTSSKNILTIERDLATSAFSPGRSYGIGLLSQQKKHTWSVGFFDATQEEDLFDAKTVTARATYVPFKNKKGLLHLGVSGSWREGAGAEYQINEFNAIYNARRIIESAKLHADKIQQYSVEFAWQHRALLLQAEFFGQEVKTLPSFNEQDASFSGYYFQASYLLGNNKHRYRKGRFVSLKPASGRGAWELVARLSNLNARDNNMGSQVNNALVGVNYYINEQVRLMFNYIHTKLDNTAEETSTGNAFSARVQYVF